MPSMSGDFWRISGKVFKNFLRGLAAFVHSCRERKTDFGVAVSDVIQPGCGLVDGFV